MVHRSSSGNYHLAPPPPTITSPTSAATDHHHHHHKVAAAPTTNATKTSVSCSSTSTSASSQQNALNNTSNTSSVDAQSTAGSTPRKLTRSRQSVDSRTPVKGAKAAGKRAAAAVAAGGCGDADGLQPTVAAIARPGQSETGAAAAARPNKCVQSLALSENGGATAASAGSQWPTVNRIRGTSSSRCRRGGLVCSVSLDRLPTLADRFRAAAAAGRSSCLPVAGLPSVTGGLLDRAKSLSLGDMDKVSISGGGDGAGNGAAAAAAAAAAATSSPAKTLCLYCDRRFGNRKLHAKHSERAHQRAAGAVPDGRRLSSRNSATSASTSTSTSTSSSSSAEGTMSAALAACALCTDATTSSATALLATTGPLAADELEALFQHMCSAHPDRYYACAQCGLRFAGAADREEHLQRLHGGVVERPDVVKKPAAAKRRGRKPGARQSGGNAAADPVTPLENPSPAAETSDSAAAVRSSRRQQAKHRLSKPQQLPVVTPISSSSSSSSSNNTTTTTTTTQPTSPLQISTTDNAPPPPLSPPARRKKQLHLRPQEETLLSRLGITQNRTTRSRRGAAAATATTGGSGATPLKTSTALAAAAGAARSASAGGGGTGAERSETPSQRGRKSGGGGGRGGGGHHQMAGPSGSAADAGGQNGDSGSGGGGTGGGAGSLGSSGGLVPLTINTNVRFTFDENFYESVNQNVRQNLSCHLDGKLDSGPMSPAPRGPAQAVPSVRSTLVRTPPAIDSLAVEGHEIHEATALSALTAFPTLLTAQQYGAEPSVRGKMKKPITKNSWKWKWDSVRKYKYVSEGGKFVKKIKQPAGGLRDLSKLDMWTQLTMRSKHEQVRRHELMTGDVMPMAAEATEELDAGDPLIGDTVREEKRRLITQLDAILDRRILPRINVEQNAQRLVKAEATDATPTDFLLPFTVLANRAAASTATASVTAASSSSTTTTVDPPADFTATLCLRRRDLAADARRDQLVLSGEWARPRCYICCGCGGRFETIKVLEDHKIARHPHVQSTHYEIVGKELMDGNLFRHFFISAKALQRGAGERRPDSKQPAQQQQADQQQLATTALALPAAEALADDSMDSNSMPYSLGETKSDPFDMDSNSRNSKVSAASMPTASALAVATATAATRPSFGRKCTKCQRPCSGLVDLYRHMLDCSGDYAWMLAKKRLNIRHRYFGARRRRAQRAVQQTRKPTTSAAANATRRGAPADRVRLRRPQQAPRPRPSDAESIQRMLADLPAKRTCHLSTSTNGESPAKPRKSQQPPTAGAAAAATARKKLLLVESAATSANPAARSTRSTGTTSVAVLSNGGGASAAKRKTTNSNAMLKSIRRKAQRVISKIALSLRNRRANNADDIQPADPKAAGTGTSSSKSKTVEAEPTTEPAPKPMRDALRRCAKRADEPATAKPTDTPLPAAEEASGSSPPEPKTKKSTRSIKALLKDLKAGACDKSSVAVDVVAEQAAASTVSQPSTPSLSERLCNVQNLTIITTSSNPPTTPPNPNSAAHVPNSPSPAATQLVSPAPSTASSTSSSAAAPVSAPAQLPSPNVKRRPRKLNDCIAMLTGKLTEKLGVQFPDPLPAAVPDPVLQSAPAPAPPPTLLTIPTSVSHSAHQQAQLPPTHLPTVLIVPTVPKPSAAAAAAAAAAAVFLPHPLIPQPPPVSHSQPLNIPQYSANNSQSHTSLADYSMTPVDLSVRRRSTSTELMSSSSNSTVGILLPPTPVATPPTANNRAMPRRRNQRACSISSYYDLIIPTPPKPLKPFVPFTLPKAPAASVEPAPPMPPPPAPAAASPMLFKPTASGERVRDTISEVIFAVSRGEDLEPPPAASPSLPVTPQPSVADSSPMCMPTPPAIDTAICLPIAVAPALPIAAPPAPPARLAITVTFEPIPSAPPAIISPVATVPVPVPVALPIFPTTVEQLQPSPPAVVEPHRIKLKPLAELLSPEVLTAPPAKKVSKRRAASLRRRSMALVADDATAMVVSTSIICEDSTGAEPLALDAAATFEEMPVAVCSNEMVTANAEPNAIPDKDMGRAEVPDVPTSEAETAAEIPEATQCAVVVPEPVAEPISDVVVPLADSCSPAANKRTTRANTTAQTSAAAAPVLATQPAQPDADTDPVPAAIDVVEPSEIAPEVAEVQPPEPIVPVADNPTAAQSKKRAVQMNRRASTRLVTGDSKVRRNAAAKKTKAKANNPVEPESPSRADEMSPVVDLQTTQEAAALASINGRTPKVLVVDCMRDKFVSLEVCRSAKTPEATAAAEVSTEEVAVAAMSEPVAAVVEAVEAVLAPVDVMAPADSVVADVPEVTAVPSVPAAKPRRGRTPKNPKVKSKPAEASVEFSVQIAPIATASSQQPFDLFDLVKQGVSTDGADPITRVPSDVPVTAEPPPPETREPNQPIVNKKKKKNKNSDIANKKPPSPTETDTEPTAVTEKPKTKPIASEKRKSAKIPEPPPTTNPFESSDEEFLPWDPEIGFVHRHQSPAIPAADPDAEPLATTAVDCTVPLSVEVPLAVATPPESTHNESISPHSAAAISPTTTANGQRPRKRRKNELAKIIADQLLESFKQVDQSRIGELRLLHDMSIESGSDDVLLSSTMTNTPPPKRKSAIRGEEAAAKSAPTPPPTSTAAAAAVVVAAASTEEPGTKIKSILSRDSSANRNNKSAKKRSVGIRFNLDPQSDSGAVSDTEISVPPVASGTPARITSRRTTVCSERVELVRKTPARKRVGRKKAADVVVVERPPTPAPVVITNGAPKLRIHVQHQLRANEITSPIAGPASALPLSLSTNSTSKTRISQRRSGELADSNNVVARSKKPPKSKAPAAVAAAAAADKPTTTPDSTLAVNAMVAQIISDFTTSTIDSRNTSPVVFGELTRSNVEHLNTVINSGQPQPQLPVLYSPETGSIPVLLEKPVNRTLALLRKSDVLKSPLRAPFMSPRWEADALNEPVLSTPPSFVPPTESPDVPPASPVAVAPTAAPLSWLSIPPAQPAELCNTNAFVSAKSKTKKNSGSSKKKNKKPTGVAAVKVPEVAKRPLLRPSILSPSANADAGTVTAAANQDSQQQSFSNLQSSCLFVGKGNDFTVDATNNLFTNAALTTKPPADISAAIHVGRQPAASSPQLLPPPPTSVTPTCNMATIDSDIREHTESDEDLCLADIAKNLSTNLMSNDESSNDSLEPIISALPMERIPARPVLPPDAFDALKADVSPPKKVSVAATPAATFVQPELPPAPVDESDANAAPVVLEGDGEQLAAADIDPYDMDENTNTDLVDMDLEDTMSVYTSFSMDTTLTAGGSRPKRRRRQKRSILSKSARKAKRADDPFVSPNEHFCAICSKSFSSASGLTSHRATLKHISKLSEVEFRQSTKEVLQTDMLESRSDQLGEANVAPPNDKASAVEDTTPAVESTPIVNVDPVVPNEEAAIPISPRQRSASPVRPMTPAAAPQLPSQAPQEQRPAYPLPPPAPPAPAAVPAAVNLSVGGYSLASGIEPISSPEHGADFSSQPPPADRYMPNPAAVLSLPMIGSPRHVLSQEERLFYECCSMLKGSERRVSDSPPQYYQIPQMRTPNPDKPVTPRSSEQYTYVVPEGSNSKGTPRIDLNHFSDISSDSNPAYSCPQIPNSRETRAQGGHTFMFRTDGDQLQQQQQQQPSASGTTLPPSYGPGVVGHTRLDSPAKFGPTGQRGNNRVQYSEQFADSSQDAIENVAHFGGGSATGSCVARHGGGYPLGQFQTIVGAGTAVASGSSAAAAATAAANEQALTFERILHRERIGSNSMATAQHPTDALLDAAAAKYPSRSPFESPLHSASSQSSTISRPRTKAAMKGYENFRVSIPTTGIDLQQALERSPPNATAQGVQPSGGCKLAALADIALGNDVPHTIGCDHQVESSKTPFHEAAAAADIAFGHHFQVPPAANEYLASAASDERYDALQPPNRDASPPPPPPPPQQQLVAAQSSVGGSATKSRSTDRKPIGNKLGFNQRKKKPLPKSRKHSGGGGGGNHQRQQHRRTTPSSPAPHSANVFDFDDSLDSYSSHGTAQNASQMAASSSNATAFGQPSLALAGAAAATDLPNDDDDAVSHASSYSDRDDFNYENSPSEESNTSEATSCITKRSAKSINNAAKKCLIMGRIFKGVKARTEVANSAQAVAVAVDKQPADHRVKEVKKPIPKQELDKMFDSLRGEAPKTAAAAFSMAAAKVVNTESSSAVEANHAASKRTAAGTDAINAKNDQPSMAKPSKATIAKPSKAKPKASGSARPKPASAEVAPEPKQQRQRPRKAGRALASIEQECGMSMDKIYDIMGVGQRKTQRRCTANKQRTFAETWSSDEYEDFHTTSDIIALIQEAEKKANRAVVKQQNSKRNGATEAAGAEPKTKAAKTEAQRAKDVDLKKAKAAETARSAEAVATTSSTPLAVKSKPKPTIMAMPKPKKTATFVGVASPDAAKEADKSDTDDSSDDDEDEDDDDARTISAMPYKESMNHRHDADEDEAAGSDPGSRPNKPIVATHKPASIKKRRKTIAFKEDDHHHRAAAVKSSAGKSSKSRKSGNNPAAAASSAVVAGSSSSSSKPIASGSGIKPSAKPMARRKRIASEMLYYWSSSSDEEFGRIKPRETFNDDNLEQHGWIVGDSHKKLVTLLAHAKGKKIEDCGVKETAHKKK